jgi:hydrogenase/urease accessory protein HupE
MGSGDGRPVKPIAAVTALVWLAVLGRPTMAAAHTTATGLTTLVVSGSTLSYRLTLLPNELPAEAAHLLTSAADGDPASVERVAIELRRRISARAGDTPCRPGRARIQGSRLGDGRVTLEQTIECPAPPARLSIRDDWFEIFGEHYRTVARIETPRGAREAVFLPDAREITIDLGRSAAGHGAGFFRLGVEHILTGYDHLLFLLALLLRGGRLLSLLKIITAFTIAHSVTLALAVLGIVTLPDRVVEPAIAASIVWVALENLFRRNAPSQRWLVSFLFGLVHGFGFASAIAPLELPPGRLALALLGFNLGVETGQAFVVALLLPVLLGIRGRSWEPRIVQAASIGVAAFGAAWLAERLFLAS